MGSEEAEGQFWEPLGMLSFRLWFTLLKLKCNGWFVDWKEYETSKA